MNERADPAWERPGLADREGPLTEWQAAAQRYRLDFGWPAWAFEHTVWITARDVEALDVPGTLGERAMALLRDNDITPSVFAAPDPYGTRWVFLVVHNDHTRAQWTPRLAAVGVDHGWAGAALDLPPTRYDDHRLEWVAPPSLPLPELSTVAEAITRAGAVGPGR